MTVDGDDRITLSQNIKTKIGTVEVFAVNVFRDEAQVIVAARPGDPPTWIDVRVGTRVDIDGTAHVVESISGTAGEAPEGRATGRVVLARTSNDGREQ